MSGQTEGWRVVVTIPEPNPLTWELPPAELHERTGLIGGLRTLHELAVAAAASGRAVELRGPVSRPVLDALAAAAGVRPELPTTRRRPDARDIVVNIEGEHDPLRFARYILSPARLVIAVLAPPGQWGWPFVSPWRPESPLTIALDSVARPEHFRAMAALDVDLWTHMVPVYERARAVGARCAFIGSGDPAPLRPPSRAKDIPVVYLEANRWRPLAEEVARNMRTPVFAIPEGEHEAIMAVLGRAQVMLWPSRVEGDGRLLREGRARGAVVVSLASNVYATGLDEASGAVTVERLEQMPGVVEALLADPRRLEVLSQAGIRTAGEQVDWRRYVERVDAAIAAIEARPESPAANAWATFGERLGEVLDEGLRAVARVAELDAHLADAAARVAVLDRELEAAREIIGELGRQFEQGGGRAGAASLAPAPELARANAIEAVRSVILRRSRS